MALSRDVRRLTDDLREAHQGRAESLTTLRADTARYRADLRSAHQQMASALSRDLDEANARRHGAESDRRNEMAHAARQRAAHLKGVRRSVASMRTEFASKLKELRNDFGEAHRAWTEFTAFMRRARATASVAAAAGRPADAAAAELLPERVLRFLGEQSAGLRLGELQKAFGVPRRQLARLMDELVAAGKAKLDKQGAYFTRR